MTKTCFLFMYITSSLYAISMIPPDIVYPDKTVCVKAIISDRVLMVIHADNVLDCWSIAEKKKIKHIKLPCEIYHEDCIYACDDQGGTIVVFVKQNILYQYNVDKDLQFSSIPIESDNTICGMGFDDAGFFYCESYEGLSEVRIWQYDVQKKQILSHKSIPVDLTPVGIPFDPKNLIWTVYESNGTVNICNSRGEIQQVRGKYLQPLLSDQPSQIKVILDEESQFITASSFLPDMKKWGRQLLPNEQITAQSRDGRRQVFVKGSIYKITDLPGKQEIVLSGVDELAKVCFSPKGEYVLCFPSVKEVRFDEQANQSIYAGTGKNIKLFTVADGNEVMSVN